MLNRVESTDSGHALMAGIRLDDFSRCSLSYLFILRFHFPRNLSILQVLISSRLMGPKRYSLLLLVRFLSFLLRFPRGWPISPPAGELYGSSCRRGTGVCLSCGDCFRWL